MSLCQGSLRLLCALFSASSIGHQSEPLLTGLVEDNFGFWSGALFLSDHCQSYEFENQQLERLNHMIFNTNSQDITTRAVYHCRRDLGCSRDGKAGV